MPNVCLYLFRINTVSSNTNIMQSTKDNQVNYSIKIDKPKSKINTMMPDGFFYSHQERDVVVVFSKILIAN